MSSDVSRAWQIGYSLCCFAIFLFFSIFWNTEKGALAGFSFAVISLTLKIRWDLIRKFWFITYMSIVIFLHCSLIFYSDGIIKIKPTIFYAPIIMADFGFIIFSIYIIEYLLKKFDKIL